MADRENQDIIYGNTQYPYCWIADEYPKQVDWDLGQMIMYTIDIEVECENGFPKPEDAAEPMLSITIKNFQSGHIHVWGIGEFVTEREDVTYVQCESEVHLFKEFLSFWENNTPDIVTGWNTEFFDIPYLVNRIRNVFDDDETKRLSPWKMFSDVKYIKWDVTIRHIPLMVLLHLITLISIKSSHTLIRSDTPLTTLRLWNWVSVRMVSI